MFFSRSNPKMFKNRASILGSHNEHRCTSKNAKKKIRCFEKFSKILVYSLIEFRNFCILITLLMYYPSYLTQPACLSKQHKNPGMYRQCFPFYLHERIQLESLRNSPKCFKQSLLISVNLNFNVWHNRDLTATGQTAAESVTHRVTQPCGCLAL